MAGTRADGAGGASARYRLRLRGVPVTLQRLVVDFRTEAKLEKGER
jgi:hypothetical protein